MTPVGIWDRIRISGSDRMVRFRYYMIMNRTVRLNNYDNEPRLSLARYALFAQLSDAALKIPTVEHNVPTASSAPLCYSTGKCCAR